MSKFKSIKAAYNEVVSKIKEKEDGGQTYDNSWKFSPTLPSNKPKINYVVRILPNVHVNDGLDEPWLEAFAHIFTRPNGKKAYTICPTSNGKEHKCPICEKSRAFWAKVNNGEASKAEEDIARAYNRKPRFYVNVLVVDDPRKGTEEDQTGKVLVWEVGPQVFEKFKDAFFEQKLAFYDVAEGYNFNVVIKNKGGNNNYESSHFSSAPSAISDDEEELDRIHGQIYNLQEKITGRLRSYDDLKKLITPEGGSGDVTEGKEIDSEEVAPPKAATPKPAPKPAPKAAAAEVEGETDSDDGGIDLDSLSDDDLFKN
jgi:hypothetical protein